MIAYKKLKVLYAEEREKGSKRISACKNILSDQMTKYDNLYENGTKEILGELFVFFIRQAANINPPGIIT